MESTTTQTPRTIPQKLQCVRLAPGDKLIKSVVLKNKKTVNRILTIMYGALRGIQYKYETKAVELLELDWPCEI